MSRDTLTSFPVGVIRTLSSFFTENSISSTGRFPHTCVDRGLTRNLLLLKKEDGLGLCRQ